MWSLSPKRYLSAFAPLFLLLVGVATASYVRAARFASGEKWVIHTHQVIAEITQIPAELSQAESARRDYVFIGDRTLLIDFDDAEVTLSQHLKKLKLLTADNARQHATTAELPKPF